MKISIDIVEDAKDISLFQLNSTYNLSDPRFGGQGTCISCKDKSCPGHYAFLDIGTYIIHPIFKKRVLRELGKICTNCGYRLPDKVPKNYRCSRCKIMIDSCQSTESLEPEEIRELFKSSGNNYYKCIVRNIVIPPPGIRPKDDVEWPSDLSHAYSLLIKCVAEYKKSKRTQEYRTIIEKYYERVLSSSSKNMSGKEGIFRELMKGKRLDKSARSVVVGDPEIFVDEVLIPKVIANKIVISEICFKHNSRFLKTLASEGKVFLHGVPMEPTDVIQGQVYERNLIDGDSVLFNRQPSLSKDSLMSFKVRIRKDNVLAIGMNHIIASAFNADFDGDEMNIFANWGIMSQAELYSLCCVDNCENMRPIQDTVTGEYLLRRSLVDRRTFMDCLSAVNVSPFDYFSLRNISCKRCTGDRIGCEECTRIREGYLYVCGDCVLDHLDTRNRTKYYHDLQVVISRWLLTVGFNVSADDCSWREEDVEELGALDNEDDIVELSQKKCMELYKESSIYKMVESKGKGNMVNMSQIMACVGHQYLESGRTFIRSSYLGGLNPREFVDHSAASRKGVTNTGVQTSVTGYLNRRASMITADCAVDYLGCICEGNRIISFPKRS